MTDPNEILPVSLLKGGRGSTPYFDPLHYPDREVRIHEFADGAVEPSDGPPVMTPDPAVFLDMEPGGQVVAEGEG